MGSPQDVRAVEKSLASSFSGCSFRPVESNVVRSGPAVEVRKNKFAREPALERDTFLGELRSVMGSFSALVTAEFQVTSIDAGSSALSVSNFPRQMRTGCAIRTGGRGQRLLPRTARRVLGTGMGIVGHWRVFACAAGDCLMRPGAAPPRQSLPTSRRRLSPAMRPTRPNCSEAPTTGEPFSTWRAALISTDTTESQSAISTTTDLTTFIFASLPVFPIGSIATAATELSKTSRRLPEWASWKILRARFLPISITMAGRT